jgi:hypothetical protein
LSLYTRGLDAFGGTNVFGLAHGYLDLTNSSQPGLSQIIEGQDNNGTLKAVDAAYSGPPDGYLSSDKPTQNTYDGSISGAAVCGLAATLAADVSTIDSANAAYSKFGPNSNSALRYFLQSLPSSSWANVPFLWGYNTSIPGVN